MISFDQWRGDWLHQKWLNLPHLRNLALNGWDVRRCYTSSPQCVPARASWLTGKTPGELGVTRNIDYSVPVDSPSFVRELRDKYNYKTILLGKSHWTPHSPGIDLRDNLPLMNRLGFDHVREIAGPRALAVVDCELTDKWSEEGFLEAYRQDLEMRYQDGCIHTVRPTILPNHLYPDLWLTDVALHEIASLPNNQPWFLWVSYPGPHEPFDVPSSWRGSHGDFSIPPPEDRPKNIDQLNKLAPPDSELARKISRWPDGIPHSSLMDLREDYADHLSLLDAQVGKLIEAIDLRFKKKKIAISICSDHGELLGDWGLLLKGCFLEGAVRSLFLHHPPGGRKGLRRLWNPSSRPYGLTQTLWAAANAVRQPDQGSFGKHLRSISEEVLVEFGNEKMIVR